MTSDELADRLIILHRAWAKWSMRFRTPGWVDILQVNLFGVDRLPLQIIRKLVPRKAVRTSRTNSAFA
jgi:hypothetical protein